MGPKLKGNIEFAVNDGNLGIDQINAEEMDLYNNFTGQINEGAYFDDFLGLWALGMDLLPSNGESLVIYVFRSCDCTMKAWVNFYKNEIELENITKMFYFFQMFRGKNHFIFITKKY